MKILTQIIYHNKLFILIIVIIFILFIIPIKNNKYGLENKLIRYMKINKKEIKINKREEKLNSAIKYVNFIKESNHQIHYSQVEKPKISFITTVFNQEKYLPNFIFSVQNQKLKEYEFIFIDDFSVDNSTKIIHKFEENDKRIKLIKNKKNMGTLYSRFIGELNAISEYIIIQFHSIWKFKNEVFIKEFSYNYKKTIYQPYLSYIFYYDSNKKEGAEYNCALWNKLIKKEIANKAFNWIGENYLKEKIMTHNDLIILFSLLKNANSFKYIDEFGYFYYFRATKNSASNSWQNFKRSNEIVHGLFTNIKFLYTKTDNSYLDKYFCIYIIHNYYNLYNKLFKYINNKELSYIKEIFSILINSDYISKKINHTFYWLNH